MAITHYASTVTGRPLCGSRGRALTTVRGEVDCPPCAQGYDAVIPAPAPTPNVQSVTAVDSILPTLARLAELKAQSEVIDTEVKALRSKVKDTMGDVEVGTVKGQPIVHYKSTIRSSLDAAAVKRDWPEVAEKCMKHQTVRTLVIKDLP